MSIKNQCKIKTIRTIKPKYNQSYRRGSSKHGSHIKVVLFLLKPLGHEPQLLKSPFSSKIRPQYHPGQDIFAEYCDVLKLNVKNFGYVKCQNCQLLTIVSVFPKIRTSFGKIVYLDWPVIILRILWLVEMITSIELIFKIISIFPNSR